MTEEITNTYTIKKRSLILSVVLSLITFNIYTFKWLYTVLKDSDRIATKKRNSIPIYRALIMLYIVLFTFCIMWDAVIIFLAVRYDTRIVFPFVEISSQVMEDVALTALMIVLLIPILLSAIGFAVCSIIVTVRLAKNLGAPVGYYIVFQLFLGITVINLFAQDEINPYAGTYAEGEQPMYLSQPVRCKDQMYEA